MKLLIPILALLTTLNSSAFFGDKKKEVVPIKESFNQGRAKLENENNTIGLFKKNADSVVNITNIQLVKSGWFFDFDVTKVPAGAGSGFVWDKNGHIVTNYHVIQNGRTFLVTFRNDKKQYKAKLVGSLPQRDIAVLKLEEMPPKLHPVQVGNSKTLQVGQKALAIGNPFGLDHSLTEGIISALGRKIKGIGGVDIHGMIQTDSSINPGNSGGPLLNSSGEVIGMNTMIYSASGSSAGIGFAVPADIIQTVVPQLIENGHVIYPALGITLVPNNIKEYVGIERGVIINEVSPGSGAQKSGLEGVQRDRRGRYLLGDVILRIDDEAVNDYNDIYNLLSKYKPGDTVKVSFKRGNKMKNKKVKLQAREMKN